ncbi:uncharacterized protein M6B38_336405 [Iris pallida]|uniref:Uncharacterized protein n=1 Tax=Iris pallida TaxID=29817 RepID=A0AAX6GZQ1_IRIPA|nr:uncharacterized protein M6B38_336405 [Iris pallida]
MDDAWRNKCTSAWQPPPPPLAAAGTGTGTAPPASENQVDMNYRRPIHPFILQGTKHKDHPTVQEPLVFHTLNLDPAKSGKTELSNSFRALLSGHSHLTTDFSQLPNMKSVFSKLHVPNGEADVSGSNLCAPVTNIPYFSENHDGVRMSNTEVSSFVVKKRPSLMPKTPDWYSSLQISTSHRHGSRAAKPGSNQSFQGSSTGMVVSSISCGRPIAASPGDTSQCHASNIHTPRTKPIDARSSAPGHDSAFFGGRPRVFCMNAVGVLFLSDMGLLGVLCFCHSLQMSLAKFCEHSGPSSVNPGVAVRLENGMTVARWRRLCFGNNAPDDDKGWDWPDILKEKAGLVGSKGIGFPSSSKAPETIDFGGSGKSGKCWSKSIHSNHPHPGVGQTAFKSWSNTSMDNMHQHNRLEGYNHIFNSFPSSSQSPVPPAVVHNHTLQAGKESPNCLHKASQSILSKEEQNVWSCLVTNRDNSKGQFADPPISFPYSGIKRSLGHGHYISRGSTTSEAYIMAGDGNSSNVDLSLGQPSQATHASVMSFPTTMNRLQLGTMHTSPKARVNLPLSDSTDYPRLTKKARQTIQTAQLDAPSSSNRAQKVGSDNAFNHSEPTELAEDATKNSLISLFLSHLNTEGNSSSQSAGIVNSNRHLMTRSLDIDSVSGNCNPAQSITDINNRYEQKYVKDGYELSNNMDKVKGLGLIDDKSCNIVKGSYVIHNKQTTDTRIPKPATGEHFVNRVFSVDAVKPSWPIHRGSSIFQNVADSTSNQSGEVPSLRNKEHHNYAIYCSTNPQSHATSRSGFLNPGISEALTTESLNNAEPTFVLPDDRSADLSQHMMDENIGHLALRHIVELKQDQSSVTCKTSPRHQRLCCQKTMELQRMSCNNVLASSEDSRQGSYCGVQRDPSRFALRPVPSCSNCYSSAGAEMLASKPGTRGNGCCNCSAVTQRMPQFSTCHVCGAEEHPCLRLGRTSNSRSDGIKQMNSQKEQSPSISRNCCCAIPSKSLTGCCFLGGDNMPSGYINEHDVCGKARTVHIAQSCDKNHMFQDVNFRSDQCECSKKNIVVKNDVQNGRWRDVPTKLIVNCNGTLGDKHEEVLEASSVATSRYLGTTLKESDEIHQTTESRNERQMSNNCSGSSAPAVTEISVEFNNTNFSATNTEDTKVAYDPLVDEASGIEKYGSSDEELGSSGCEELVVVSDKLFPKQVDCLPSHSSGKPITNLREEVPSNKTRVGNQGYASRGAQANIKQIEPIERVFKSEKRRETMTMNKLNISAPKSDFYPIDSISSYCNSTWDSSSPKKCEALQSDNEDPKLCNFPVRSSSVKRKRSALFTSKSLSLNRENHDNLSKSDRIQFLTGSAEKEAKAVSLEKNIAKQKGIHSDTGKPPKYMSLSSIGNSRRSEMGATSVKARPVVCGRSGILSNGRPSSQQKPAKLVSLSLILEKTKRCDINENGVRPKLTSKTKKPHLDANIECCNELTFLKVQHETEDSSDVRISSVLVADKDEQCSKKNDWCSDEFPTTESKTGDESDRLEKPFLNHEHRTSQTKPRFKEARRCSLSELIDKNKFATEHLYAQNNGESHSSDLAVEPKISLSTRTGTECHCPESSIPKSSLSNKINLEKHSHKSQYHADALCQTNTQRSSKAQNCQPFPLNSDAFCSVCGSSDKEKTNYLLECNSCFIRVHQACYGVSRVPKGHWLCRPCKTNSRNIVCVLCGYEGGAMTRAVKSQTIVKSLLKVWNVGIKSNNLEPNPSSETDKNELLHTRAVGEASKVGNSCSVTDVTSPICEAFPETPYDISSNQTSIIGHSETVSKYIEMPNSVTAGVLDPSVIQWVHMVCGLWTPGTRCLNVDTMDVFDVSGASAARKNVVCSMCNRPGGSCIQCRILSCSVHFHPWCAHQKGLLQSETEGDDNEKLGFYGRCTLHATQNGLVVDSLPVDTEVASPRKDLTCARTEGFKGHKSEEGSRPNHRRPSNDSGACIVSQEQINAWLHINGQKSCTRPLAKPPCSEVEHDFRKEYFRYKQLKAWKQLVVYKSGIHALGLYTSQLIARGAMVVEYVGEIVGLRVADKRELEYQSGRRVQYKSACYFFRIDKEQIIDATRKGGIARFVNHSCEPNCVAKVISIRNEKKVVFFAERDINPGEEITYDYHFNSEDEGQKIHCFCNSKNCRQYLN